MISIVKKKFNDKYSVVQAHIDSATIKKHAESFNAYIALRNKKKDQEYNRSVNEPKKHDNTRLHNIIIPGQSITCSKKKLRKGYIELPLVWSIKKTLESRDCRPKSKIPENIMIKKTYTGRNHTHKKWKDV